MDRTQYPLLEKIQKKVKIFKIKSIRAWHRFDKATGTSRLAKRIALIAALKTITFIMPNAQISLHAQNTNKKINRTELLAEAAHVSIPSFEDFREENKEEIATRQADFAKDLWETLKDNVEEVQYGAKIGKKTKTLKNLFGKDINPRFYCAISGLRSLEQTIEKKDYPEYEFLLNCIENPHACLSVINGLEKNFGKGAKTTNIRNKLRDELKKNSSSVCIAIVNSSQNTSSGKHFVFVLPNKVVVDSLINEADTVKGKIVSFNVDKITDSDSYFTGSRNSGYLFNITNMSEYDLVMLFYNKYIEEKTTTQKAKEKKSPVIAQVLPPELKAVPKHKTTKIATAKTVPTKKPRTPKTITPVQWNAVGIRQKTRS